MYLLLKLNFLQRKAISNFLLLDKVQFTRDYTG